MRNYKNLIKLFLILVVAFLISSFSIKNIFLANSPEIRPNLGGYLLSNINLIKDNILAKLDFIGNQNREEIVSSLKNNLKPITKGVSAATRDNNSYTEFKLNEIDWARITYTLKDGQQVVIQYPKGTNPPPQEIYESQ